MVAVLGNNVGESADVVAFCLRLVGTVSAFRLMVDRSLMEFVDMSMKGMISITDTELHYTASMIASHNSIPVKPRALLPCEIITFSDFFEIATQMTVASISGIYP